VLTNIGFVAYMQLTTSGEVSSLAPMIGLYSVMPVAAGLIFRGDSRTVRKFAGIALSFAAILVLGFSDVAAFEGPGGDTTVAASKVALFLVAFCAWGAHDVLASAVTCDTFTTAVSGLIGQLLVGAMCGVLSAWQLTGTLVAAEVEPRLTSLPFFNKTFDGRATVQRFVPFGWPHLLYACANGLGSVGWLAFVRLGSLAQASSFVPVVSLYTFVPVLLSFVFLGEPLTALKGAGIVLAVAAVLLMSRSSSSSSSNGNGKSTQIVGWSPVPLESDL